MQQDRTVTAPAGRARAGTWRRLNPTVTTTRQVGNRIATAQRDGCGDVELARSIAVARRWSVDSCTAPPSPQALAGLAQWSLRPDGHRSEDSKPESKAAAGWHKGPQAAAELCRAV